VCLCVGGGKTRLSREHGQGGEVRWPLALVPARASQRAASWILREPDGGIGHPRHPGGGELTAITDEFPSSEWTKLRKVLEESAHPASVAQPALRPAAPGSARPWLSPWLSPCGSAPPWLSPALAGPVALASGDSVFPWQLVQGTWLRRHAPCEVCDWIGLTARE